MKRRAAIDYLVIAVILGVVAAVPQLAEIALA